MDRPPRDRGPRLIEELYDELHKLASARLAKLPPGQTLQATALVHEAYLRLGTEDSGWNGREHFFGSAARAIRDVLVEAARRKGAAKRGGDGQREELHSQLARSLVPAVPITDVLALDEALRELEGGHPRKARLVDLRYFAGLSMAEIAEVLGVTTRTLESDWRFARAWLHRRLGS